MLKYEMCENDEKELEMYEESVKNEINIDYLESTENISDFTLVEFESRSNGRNRKSRKGPREVSIIKYRNLNYFMKYGSEVKSKSKGAIGLDVLAMEAFENTGTEPTVENLVEAIRTREQIKKKIKRYNSL